MKKWAYLVVLVAVFLYGYFPQKDLSETSGEIARPAANTIQIAYETQQSDLQVSGEGRVVKILPDDNQGSRHQRFILKINNGPSLLVAHNIDLAPRVQNLVKGDIITFFGEYEWNAKGGVLHWTHDDPQGRHANGWLKHDGKTYR